MIPCFNSNQCYVDKLKVGDHDWYVYVEEWRKKPGGPFKQRN